MLVRTPTLHNENWTLTYVPIQAGEDLQLCPVREQHPEGHSKKGYAKFIIVCVADKIVVLAERKLTPYVYAVAADAKAALNPTEIGGNRLLEMGWSWDAWCAGVGWNSRANKTYSPSGLQLKLI
ncbi:hypothetical protein TIFTF001_040858 [Ficus carica]|uniref:Uncharacterized protein n=1 Tax=Ficus carica TaxID=3494 RepID=A0AA87ZLL5_FICCA|nr:hypothetical protein TIFTF001_040858 [Ficus carica]